MKNTPSDSDSDDVGNVENSDSTGESSALHLSFTETRILGCLLEKAATTPDHYPLTLKSLQSACNQSSNRDPVVSFDSKTLEQGLEDLRYNGLCMLVHQAGARVGKYKHTLENKLPYLTDAQQALICVLLLRGQQTTGELRQRTERMHAFSDIAAVERALDALMQYDPTPLAKKFPPGGGRRVASYAHCLSGIPADDGSSDHAAAPANTVVTTIDDSPTWRETLESRITELESEVGDLKQQLDQLRSDLGA